MSEPREIELSVLGAYDLRATLGALSLGPADPCQTVRDDGIWRATHTPMGPCTWRAFVPERGRVVLQAWGPGADWVAARAEDLLGVWDRPDFEVEHPLIARLQRRFPGRRLVRTHRVVETMVLVICGQLVTGKENLRSWTNLLRRYGQVAPGPVPLRVPPSPEVLRALPEHAFIPLGLLPRHARAVRLVCSRANRMEEASTMSPDQARRRLTALPGIGLWTAAETQGRAMGDPDAVPVGDYHLPHIVSYALAGEERGDDRRMLELLEPFEGNRYRVIRLLEAAHLGPPRKGPRSAVRPLPRG